MLRTKRSTYLPLSVRAGAYGLVLVLAVASVATGTSAQKEQHPAALMNWMVDGTFHALVVDKSKQQLQVWRTKDGEPSLVETYRCSTGEKTGDKWVRGDMKTPEGVYFFCSVIDGERLPTKYGLWAFTTDYPNFVDRRHGKNGDGIWLHGRDKPLGPRPDSNGCIAMENEDLAKVSRFIRLQGTPLIILPHVTFATKAEIIEQEREIRGFIESWRQSWESKDVDRFMNHYSPDFQSGWLDFAGWADKKRRLAKRYSKIDVKLGNVYLYRQDGLITAICTQSYKSDAYRNTGIKMLFIRREGRCRIYAEDYHQIVDEPFPVATLLARAGVEPVPSTDTNADPDLRIQLVSTDESENRTTHTDVERPTPSAPARAVVLERSEHPEESPQAPDLAVKQFLPRPAEHTRLMVACALAGDTGDRLQLTPRTRPPLVIEEPSVIRVAAHRRAEIEQETSRISQNPASKEEREPTPKTGPDLGQKASAPKDPAPDPGNKERKAVLELLQTWKAAWETKNVDKFIKLYHPEFRCAKMNYGKFFESKKHFFSKYGVIRIELDQVDIRKVDGRLTVKFLQTFQGDEYSDKGWKSMVLAGSKTKGLRIVSEKWAPL
ncbi:MAG: L,D-transpeptidase family protein [Thermodesulfobacteriota bacterium]